MINRLKKIEKSWKMESVSEPFFYYDDNGLEIYFIFFLGEDARIDDVNMYISSKTLKHECDIPDEIYNNAGFRMMHIKFDFFDSFSCTNRTSVLSDYIDEFDLSSGIYENINNEVEKVGYVIVGHDLFISVKANNYHEYMSKL